MLVRRGLPYIAVTCPPLNDREQQVEHGQVDEEAGGEDRREDRRGLHVFRGGCFPKAEGRGSVADSGRRLAGWPVVMV